MAYTTPWQPSCDCRCPIHYRLLRSTYDDRGCACTITCATQPVALLADHWNCALFLDQEGDLWYVPAMPNGNWDWENTGKVDSRHDFYNATVIIEHLLRLSVHVLANSGR
jgi:hypothetical protein